MTQEPSPHLLVELWPLHLTPTLIVEHPSGVTFTNQAGGIACIHPEFEGILIPLPGPFTMAKDPLRNYFEEVPAAPEQVATRRELVAEWLRWADLDSSLAARTDELVAEAWIPVHIRQQLHTRLGKSLAPFAGRRAVITYDNSD